MKRILLILCALLAMTYSAGTQAQNAWDGTVATVFAGGDGTEINPYQIADGAQLAKLAQDVNSGNTYAGTYFVLTTDIVLNDISDWENWDENTTGLNVWTPIGNYNNEFTGSIDGQGHTISGIYIGGYNGHQGLVGYLDEGGIIQNLGVEASYIQGLIYIGSVCGFNYGAVENCYNTGKVTGADYVGGICGSNNTITNCYNTGTITGRDNVGGVCGFSQTSLSYCYNAGGVTGNENVGGISGSNFGTINNCYNIGQVAGKTQIGGIAGAGGDAITNCYYLTGTAAGGINGNDVAGKAEAKSDIQFASGEVAWLLQNGQAEQIWGQTINTDNYPLWQTGNNKVYQLSLQDREETNALYANSGTFTLPLPTRTGYAFAGWFTAQTDGTQMMDNATLTEDKTLYAQWTANSYTVTFDANTSEAQGSMEPQTFTYDAVQRLAPNAFTRTGYSFTGWNTKVDGSGMFYEDEAEILNLMTEAGANITLYAQWNINTYTVTLALAEGCEEMGEVSGGGSYEYGSEATLTATANEGYKFVQWSDGDTNATRTITVTGNMELTATFIATDPTALHTPETGAWKAIGTDGMLHITGTAAEAEVYNVRGVLVYRGMARTIHMPAGVYIIRAEEQVQKAVVK